MTKYDVYISFVCRKFFFPRPILSKQIVKQSVPQTTVTFLQRKKKKKKKKKRKFQKENFQQILT